MRTRVSEKALRAAVESWTIAKLRWKEFVLADIGTPRYRLLLKEHSQRRDAFVDAETLMLRLGNRLLLEEAAKKRRSTAKTS